MAVRVADPWGPPLTLEQAKVLNSNDYLCLRYFRRADGKTPAVVKVNGNPKVWVRSPERVRIPWKYGLHEYGYVDEHNLGDFAWCTSMGTLMRDPAERVKARKYAMQQEAIKARQKRVP